VADADRRGDQRRQATTTHKRSFFEQGAQLGYVVTMDGDMNPQKFDEWVKRFKAGHEGALNAYKTLFLAGGADVKTVGTDFQQLDLKAVQGAGETRIAAAAGVPPVVVGLSEGLAGRDVLQLRAGPPPVRGSDDAPAVA
jgi:phage portal protein BeeE